MLEEELISVDDHDQRRSVTAYSELYADRAVIYLDNNDFIAAGNVEMRQDERETTADTIVYQDEIKRITAQGNVRFRDKDDQTLLCGGLVYFNDSDYMEITGGASATLKLPARYANDINQSIADMREEEAPEPVEDEPLPEEPPTRNPNIGSSIAASLRSGPAPLEGVESSALENVADNGLTPLPLPGGEGGTREIMLDFSDDEEAADVVEDAAAEVNAAEADPDAGNEPAAAADDSETEDDTANVAEATNGTADNSNAGSEAGEES
jgi:hypothetical protein